VLNQRWIGFSDRRLAVAKSDASLIAEGANNRRLTPHCRQHVEANPFNL